MSSVIEYLNLSCLAAQSSSDSCMSSPFSSFILHMFIMLAVFSLVLFSLVHSEQDLSVSDYSSGALLGIILPLHMNGTRIFASCSTSLERVLLCSVGQRCSLRLPLLFPLVFVLAL